MPGPRNRDNPRLHNFVLEGGVSEKRQRKAAERFTPVGSDEALPAVPSVVKITEADKAAAMRAWDEADTGLDGILGAAVDE